MSAFFDTNILLYAQEEGKKADIARALLQVGGKLSVQVLNEFVAVSVRKIGRPWSEVDAAVEDALDLVDSPIPMTLKTHAAARAIASAHRLAFFDALIVAAALESECETLYSEDMQSGRSFSRLTIINPFLSAGRPGPKRRKTPA